jgi:hypothetical protein
MSIFGSIMSGIFDHADSAPAPGAKTSKEAQTSAPTPQSAPAAPTPQSAADAPTGQSAAAAPIAPSTAPQSSSSGPKSPVDVTAIMDKLASQAKEKLEWRKSIVDLMKLLNLDSSIASRKRLAQELHYSGNMNDSASMNVWLHKQVMIKLAEHGGKVPSHFASPDKPS